MSNDEIQITEEVRITMSETNQRHIVQSSCFVIASTFVLRHSAFAVILLSAGILQAAKRPVTCVAVDLKVKSDKAVRTVSIPRKDLPHHPADDAKWRKVLRVAVAPQKGQDDNLPAMLGEYYLVKGRLLFVPEFPLRPGVKYRATYTTGKGRTVTREFTLPRAKPAQPAVVTQVYPTATVLPENLLKFYIHFSVPMSRGEAYRRISILDAAGRKVDGPFLELAEELWDPAGTRFTLLFDPGRIKRGLKPREDVGLPLRRGKSYTLVIDRKWESAEGVPLKESFRRKFRVGPPDERQPDPHTWRVTPASPRTKDPLVVLFPESLDAAMLRRVLRVVDASGRTVRGRIALGRHETRWEFRPTKPWTVGKYALTAETTLEDLAGNSIGRPFEVDLRSKRPRKAAKKRVRIPFEVRGEPESVR